MSPRELQRFERLFDQQMWCFGRDVLRPDDNLLAARGFQRTPPPAGAATSSLWRLAEHGAELELSSVGVGLRQADRALFVSRKPMAKQIREADTTLLHALCSWFAGYEDWVRARCGEAWRGETLTSRTRRAFVPPMAMSDAWRELARSVRATAPEA